MKAKFKLMSFAIMLGFWLSSCRTDSGPLADDVIKISPSQALKQVRVSELFAIEAYVPLIGKEALQIGSIKKILPHEQKLYILDDITHSVFCFNRNGHFEFLISTSGRGPGEYFSITDFAIHDGCLYVFDSHSGKILIYQAHDGAFLREDALPLFATHLEVLSPDSLLFFSDYTPNLSLGANVGYHNFFLVGNELKVQDAFLPFDQDGSAWNLIGKPRNLFRNNHRVLVWQHFDDNIYVLDTRGFRVAYHLDYGNRNARIGNALLALSQQEGENAIKLQQQASEMGYYELLDVAETPDNLCLTFRRGSDIFWGFYCRHTHSEKLLKATVENGEVQLPFINDIDGVEFYPLLATDGRMLISFAYAFQFDQNKVDVFSFRNQDLGQPVIVFLSLKPF
jgi:hypothetical protein